MSRLKDPKYFLLEVDPSVQSINLHVSKLPTYKEILICLLARCDNTENTNKSVYNVASQLVKEELIPIYDRARIPLQSEKNCSNAIVRLHDEMYKVMKISKRERNLDVPSKHIQNFKDKLKKTMKLWPSDAMQKISNDEDKKFLHSMMTDRVATMGGVDEKLTATEKKVAKRKEAQLKREISEEDRKKQSTSRTIEHTSESEEDLEDNDLLPVYDVNKRQHRRTKTGQNLFIPHDILKSPLVVAVAARNKISPTSLAAITSAIITSSGGDVNKFSLSYTTSARYFFFTNSRSSLSLKYHAAFHIPKRGNMQHCQKNGSVLKVLNFIEKKKHCQKYLSFC